MSEVTFNDFFQETAAVPGQRLRWVVATMTDEGEKYLVGIQYDRGKRGKIIHTPILSGKPPNKNTYFHWGTRSGAESRISFLVSDYKLYPTEVEIDHRPKRLPIKSKIFYELLAMDLSNQIGVGNTFELSHLTGNYLPLSDPFYVSDGAGHGSSPWSKYDSQRTEPILKNMVGLGIISDAPRRGRTRVFKLETDTLGIYQSVDQLTQDVIKFMTGETRVGQASVYRREQQATFLSTYAVLILKKSWKTVDKDLDRIILQRGSGRTGNSGEQYIVEYFKFPDVASRKIETNIDRL